MEIEKKREAIQQQWHFVSDKQEVNLNQQRSIEYQSELYQEFRHRQEALFTRMEHFWLGDPMMRTFLNHAHQDLRAEDKQITFHLEEQQEERRQEYRQLVQQEEELLHQRLALSRGGQ
ncbi:MULTISPECIES: DUF3958 family protein [Listeria]|uniref:DUF3958 family protein n=1 Tax=Listeria TaxID=1637 RepID=UPI000B58DA0D|nr:MULTISPECIES: DUF3958 family protein [Listeria]